MNSPGTGTAKTAAKKSGRIALRNCIVASLLKSNVWLDLRLVKRSVVFR